MNASELIERLKVRLQQHGDLPVYAIGDFCPELVVDVFERDGEFILKTDPHAPYEPTGVIESKE